MPKFSEKSASLLAQCHPELQLIFNTAIKEKDFSILSSTIRTKEEQEKFVADGKSKTMNSKHLKQKDGYSYAVDIWIYENGINWANQFGQTLLANYIIGISDGLRAAGKIKGRLIWGGNWSTFKDYPHFELSI